MDILHVSYQEALHEIPFRNLIIMQKDRMHESYKGESVEFKSARSNPKFKNMIK